MGYNRLLRVTWGYWSLEGVTRGYRGYKALPGIIILTGGYKWLQKVTGGYNRLQGITRGDRGLLE